MELAKLKESLLDSPRSRFRLALALAVLADVLQIVIFPFFVEGAASPTDDVLDAAMAAIMVSLLGWHWEFLPSFLAKLAPGLDLVPTWTLSVANVYRKWKKGLLRVRGWTCLRSASISWLGRLIAGRDLRL